MESDPNGKAILTVILGWTAFNATMDTTELSITTVRHLPFIQAPTTDLDTISTTLLEG